jgi:hypothetical protein
MNKRKKTNEQNAQTKCLGRKKNKGISTEKKTKNGAKHRQVCC